MRPTESFDRKNVTDMGLESPAEQPELRFDPQRDLSRQDWAMIDDFMAQVRAHADGSVFALHIGRLADIDRDRAQLTARDRRLIQDRLDQDRRNNNIASMTEITSAVAKINPRLFPVHDEEWGKILQYADLHSTGDSSRIKKLAEIALLDRSKLVLHQPDLSLMRRWQGSPVWADVVANIAVVKPELINMDQGQWDVLVQKLEDLRSNPRGNPADFIALAADMAVISRAQSKSALAPQQEIPVMPETKSYYE